MLNGCEKGLIDNFRQLGCNGLADKLDTALSSRHVASSELFSVMSSVTEAELLDQKQARADRLLRMAGLKGIHRRMHQCRDNRRRKHRQDVHFQGTWRAGLQ